LVQWLGPKIGFKLSVSRFDWVGFQGRVPRLGPDFAPKIGSQGWVPRLGPMVGSQGWVPWLCPKVGSKSCVLRLGIKVAFLTKALFVSEFENI
jgi:hypothetical protein